MIVETIRDNVGRLGHYGLHAFVVMPNHVHLLVTPHVPLAKFTRSLKELTAKRASRILALTGTSFWQDEGFERPVRNTQDFARIANYIESNPVRAGLADAPGEYEWSSAHRSAKPRKLPNP